MNKKNGIWVLTFMIALLVSMYSCVVPHTQVGHGFRQSYDQVNEFIHTAPLATSYIKVHFKDGKVCILDNWETDPMETYISGSGTLYDLNRIEIESGPFKIDVNEIAIIETNDHENLRSLDGERIVGLTLLTVANAAMMVNCFINPKSCYGSCPTFYVDGLSDAHNANAEGFSSSISPSLEKGDLDALNYRTSSDQFILNMKNEALETHAVNEILIHTVEKNKDEHIFCDQNGIFYTCSEPIAISNVDGDNNEIQKAIQKADGTEYFSPSDPIDLSTTEEIIIEFDHVRSTDLGVVLNFRQTLLTTFLFYNGMSYMGNEVGDYFARIETNEKLREHIEFAQNEIGGIEVSVWNSKKRKWSSIGMVYETGPLARNKVLLPYIPCEPEQGKIKLKIEMAKGSWKLDYVGLTEIYSKASSTQISPSKIKAISGKNYSTDNVLSDDEKYMVTFPGDEYQFTFDLPMSDENTEHELFLYSKGYYLEWMRSEWLADKDLKKLNKMLKKDKDTWKTLAREYKLVEADMESVFWNSKFNNSSQ